MTDPVTPARELVELLERGEAAAVSDRLSQRVRGFVADGDWSVDTYLRDEWGPGLDDLAGSPRRITDEVQVSEKMARFTLEGERGQAFVTVRFVDDGRLDGLALNGQVFEGISTIVIACPEERREEVAGFYAELLGEDRRRLPRLWFDEAPEYHAPRWPDPNHPQQLHLDILVPDLEAADEMVLGRGATLLQDKGNFRSYADPIGHPFCLYPDASPKDDAHGSPGVLGRIVIDCFSPRALAAFYQALLGMPNRIEDSPERVVIAREDASLPMLAFQHAPQFVAPRWPDPAFPQQMHFDLKFDDREAAQKLAERLGAIRLPDHGGSCPVYADPAGHPFCLCMPGE
ncbi:MAG: VOC family protein [Acidimicrobiia bacterium]